MVDKTIVHTDDAPAAIGPYSQAVVANGTVYTSGQIALDPRTGEMRGETAAEQAELALANLRAVLAAAGCSPADVVRTTVYLRTMDDFASVNEVYGRTFSDDPPARACVAALDLPKGALVEIDAVAVRPA